MPTNTKEQEMTRWRWLTVPTMLFVAAAGAAPQQAGGAGGRDRAPFAAADSVAGKYFDKYPTKLILDPEGRFTWNLVADGVDHVMKGTWRADRESVTLTAAPRDATAALFSVASVGLWSEEAGDELQSALRREFDVQVAKNCPFVQSLQAGQMSIVMGAAFASDDRQGKPAAAPSPEAEKNLARLHAAALDARSAVEAAIRPVLRDLKAAKVSPGGADRDRSLAEIDAKVRMFLLAQQDVVRAYGEQGREFPDDVVLQAQYEECFTGLDTSETGEQGGYAVHVTEATSSFAPPPVVVDFIFADGTRQHRLTDTNWAVVSHRPGSRLQRIVVDPMSKTAAATEMKVDLDQPGVVEVRMDSSLARRPPFETITFAREDSALVSTDRGWRYERLGDAPRDAD